MSQQKRIYIYDTTLRDGGQTSGVSFTFDDKKKIYKLISDFGIDFIEAGWPFANDVDTQTFDYFKGDKKLVAFGMTKRKSTNLIDEGLDGLLSSGANAITIVAKSWDFHVVDALGISLSENLELIGASVSYLKAKCENVLVDLEHFFDGYKNNPEYSQECINQCLKSGAKWIVLCDTNGGSMPFEIYDIVLNLTQKYPAIKFGIHAHNDCEMAVANSIAAIRAGALMIQGTINGLGERCGNANLTSIIPILMLKMGFDCGISPENLAKIGVLSKTLDLILGRDSNKYAPFVGSSAFAHKGGLHASAVLKNSNLYEHINPDLVGSKRHVIVSNQSGRSNVISLLQDAGLVCEKYFVPEFLNKLVIYIKQKESDGLSFENANASLILTVKKLAGDLNQDKFFKVLSYKILIGYNKDSGLSSEAIIKLEMPNKQQIFMASEGDGPVSALNNAMLSVLRQFYPEVSKIKLTDYKVRIVSHGFLDGTDSVVRTNIEYVDTSTGEIWHTVGVGTNSVDASFNAIFDATLFFLCK